MIDQLDIDEQDNQPITVDKLTCARTQIDSAIDLYFRDGDPISIHTLASAAYEILKDLNKLRGGKPLFTEFAFLNKPEDADLQKMAKRQIRSFATFFKHADRDATASMSFRARLNESTLRECEKLYRRFSSATELMNIFHFWFTAIYFERYHPEVQAKFIPDSRRIIDQVRQKYERKTKGSYYAKMLNDLEP